MTLKAIKNEQQIDIYKTFYVLLSMYILSLRNTLDMKQTINSSSSRILDPLWLRVSQFHVLDLGCKTRKIMLVLLHCTAAKG